MYSAINPNVKKITVHMFVNLKKKNAILCIQANHLDGSLDKERRNKNQLT